MARSPWLALTFTLLATVPAVACVPAAASEPSTPRPQVVELPPPPPRAPPSVTAPPPEPASDPEDEPSPESAASAAPAGPLSHSAIQATVKPAGHRLRRCYEIALAANPTLTGKVTVRFVIGGNGITRAVHAGPPDFPDATMLRCVEQVFKGYRFPAFEGEVVTVSYPFVFVPDAGTVPGTGMPMAKPGRPQPSGE